ncbi:MAG: tetratricopeptide repeat protein [bacterium]|nr:tetratricopeptide repeat protein [bacterium]
MMTTEARSWRRQWVWRALAAWGLLLPAAVSADGDSTPARWMVDRGRTIGLLTPQPSVDDAELVLVWAEAAARVDPDLAEAYLWQSDMLRRLGRTEAADSALSSYCKLSPTDISAQLDLIERQLERGQSVDQRLAYCTERLSSSGLPSIVRSDLYRWSAGLCYRTGDQQQARTHAAQAIASFPGNVAAHSLLVELADEQERPAREIAMLGAALAASPQQADLVWQMASLLDDLSLHVEAIRWYERCLSTSELAAVAGGGDADLLVALAVSYFDDGQYERARQLADRALQADAGLLDARMLLVDLARATGDPDSASHHLEALRARFAEYDSATDDPKGAVGLCQAAWFHLHYDPQPERALALSSRARELVPDLVEAQVVTGLAMLAGGDVQGAAEILQPWSPSRQWAAAGLGEALLALGRTEEAIAVLRAGESLRYSGRAYERIVGTLATRQQAPAPRPAHEDVLAVLGAFDERVLAFPKQPGASLRFEVTAPQREWAYAERWRVELKLTNTAGFPVSFGERQMVGGTVLVSARWGEGADHQLVNYLALSLALNPVLEPGESVVLTESLDVGFASSLAAGAPQRELPLTFIFLLDPVMDARGNWSSGLSGGAPVAVSVTRRPADVSRAGLDALAAALETGSEQERIRAVRAMAGLVAERETTRNAPPLDYTPRRFDELRLRKRFLAALDDSVPVVRSAALDSMRILELSPRLLELVAPRLSDRSWLVRLVAVDLLTEKQGAAFRPVLERMSQADPDELVRRLAHLRLGKLGAAPHE